MRALHHLCAPSYKRTGCIKLVDSGGMRALLAQSKDYCADLGIATKSEDGVNPHFMHLTFVPYMSVN